MVAAGRNIAIFLLQRGYHLVDGLAPIQDTRQRLFCRVAVEFQQLVFAVEVDARVLLNVVDAEKFHISSIFNSINLAKYGFWFTAFSKPEC